MQYKREVFGHFLPIVASKVNSEDDRNSSLDKMEDRCIHEYLLVGHLILRYFVEFQFILLLSISVQDEYQGAKDVK